MVRGGVCCLASDDFVEDDVCALISVAWVILFLFVFVFYFILFLLFLSVYVVPSPYWLENRNTERVKLLSAVGQRYPT